MKEELKNIKYEKRQLKNFGLLFTIIFSVAAILLFMNDYNWLAYLLGLFAIIFLSASFFFVNALRPVYKVWMSLSIILGWITTRIILFIVFYFIVFPIKILALISGKKFIDDKFKDGKNTYWNLRSENERKKINYENQF